MENKINLKKIIFIALMSALYVVFSLTLKIPMGVGAIALDLGYIILTISALNLGKYSAIVGGLGAFLESILFSPYGLSYGWVVMNIIIGIICGLILGVFNKTDFTIKKYVIAIITIIISVLIGVVAKTIIECSLYSIPYLIKLPKSLVAFGIDSFVMIIGLPLGVRLKKLFKAINN